MVNLGPCHTTAFLFENAYFLTCFRRSSILKRPNTLIQTGNFESGFKSGVFWKRTVLKRFFLVWTGENRGFGFSRKRSICPSPGLLRIVVSCDTIVTLRHACNWNKGILGLKFRADNMLVTAVYCWLLSCAFSTLHWRRGRPVVFATCVVFYVEVV